MPTRTHRIMLLFLGLAATGLHLPAAGKPNAELRRPPNVVVILTDDMGWGDLSCTGNTNLQTPNIDSIARQGVTLDRFYVCPVCSPTRAEFLTGRYHPRGGVRNVTSGGERLDLDEQTIADLFRRAGYATGAFGKWHNGTQFPYHPNARGFTEYYGFTSGHWGHYFDPILEHNNQLTRGKGFIIDDLTSHAIAFIEQHRGQPFFCYLPMNTPHSPFQVPDRFYDKFKDAEIKLRHRDPTKESLDKTRCVLAMNENIDWNVGRVLQCLDRLKIADNTIVVFFSDNGPNSWRYNGGMKGRKGSVDEGGVRVPCFIRWPGVLPAGRKTDRIAAAIDLLPTLTSLAGIPCHTRKPLDGHDLTALLEDKAVSDSLQQRRIFSHWRGRVSVRTQRYRLDPRGALFDMVEDPAQTTDVASRFPKIARALRREVARWKQEVLAEMTPEDSRPFPIGAGHRLTWLPARDGRPHGGVRRSARAPNCSYFTNWRSTDDRITWDVEVMKAGRYRPVLYYTCAPQSVGCRIELSLGDVSAQVTVRKAHDPPLVGAEADRASRGGESLVKDFRPLKMPEMELSQGRTTLTLRAVQIPGPSAIDVRWVLMERIE